MEKDELLDYLESRLRDNPKSLLFARLADEYLKRGNSDDALVLCTEGVKHHPYYTTGYFVLARAHVLRKEYDKAEAALKKVLSHDQQYLSAQKLLGDILVKTGWEAAASEHYASVIDSDPMEDRVRDLMKRYSVPADGPKPRSAALPETPASAEPESPLQPEPDSEPVATPVMPAPEMKTTVPIPPDDTDSDWTEQIREFSPEDIDLPVPLTAGLPDGTPPPADFMTDPGTAETTLPAAPDEPDSGDELESLITDLEETPAPADAPSSAKPEPVQNPEEMVDFTQNWFDLSSFDNPEEEKTEETPAGDKAQDLELDIQEVETPASGADAPPRTDEPQASDLFEKKEPEGFLNPSELEPAVNPPAPEPPPEPPARESVKPVPWFKAEKHSGTAEKSPAPQTSPVASRSGETAAARPADPVQPSRADDRSDLKIVTSTLGEIYAAQGQFEKAIEVYEALLEKSPNESRYKDKIADLQKRLKESSGK
ncbi:tetratricopeptide repeat protein [bacterium]|nr:tetratricopeptide repeat protein [bacterium]